MGASFVRKILSTSAVAFTAMLGAVFVAPTPAQAGDCSATWPCGSINNNSRFAMHTTEKWNSGTDKCARWRGGLTPEIVACKQQYLAPFGIYGGRTKQANGTYIYIDVDAFTYNSTDFYWSGQRVTKGQWIRITNGGPRKCTAEVGDLPRCG